MTLANSTSVILFGNMGRSVLVASTQLCDNYWFPFLRIDLPAGLAMPQRDSRVLGARKGLRHQKFIVMGM